MTALSMPAMTCGLALVDEPVWIGRRVHQRGVDQGGARRVAFHHERAARGQAGERQFLGVVVDHVALAGDRRGVSVGLVVAGISVGGGGVDDDVRTVFPDQVGVAGQAVHAVDRDEHARAVGDPVGLIAIALRGRELHLPQRLRLDEGLLRVGRAELAAERLVVVRLRHRRGRRTAIGRSGTISLTAGLWRSLLTSAAEIFAATASTLTSRVIPVPPLFLIEATTGFWVARVAASWPGRAPSSSGWSIGSSGPRSPGRPRCRAVQSWRHWRRRLVSWRGRCREQLRSHHRECCTQLRQSQFSVVGFDARNPHRAVYGPTEPRLAAGHARRLELLLPSYASPIEAYIHLPVNTGRQVTAAPRDRCLGSCAAWSGSSWRPVRRRRPHRSCRWC